MRNLTTLLLAGGLCTAFGCTASAPSEPAPDITRDEARALGGKQDGFDLCEWLGWYDDGVCDEFCHHPDPDCDAECQADSDCPQIYCVRAPCPSNVCVAGECVIDNPEDRCGAGERECQTCNGNFVCAPHAVSCPLVHCPPPPPPGETCGGLAGFRCSDPDQFCLYDDAATCGAADQTGTCTDRPTACTREFRPVCGCDGETHGNRCDAHASGTSVVHEGECEPPPPPPPTVGCRRGGCSSQHCIPEDAPPFFTTCEWRPEYACYQAATCERQADGGCGFTDTPDLQACLDDADRF